MKPPEADLAAYPLLSALRDRRSRRFGRGMAIPPGPLQFTSHQPPVPVSESAEATLAWAACGVTGPALADLAYGSGQGGSIMAGLVGRTVASGDCLQTVGLVVMNDQGTWWLRRPQDLPATDVAQLLEYNRRGAYLEAYRRTRVRLADRRMHPPVEPIFNINANRWSAHAPGSSYFLPIGDLTPMYLNGLLEILNEHTGVFVLDERRSFRPAGLDAFAKRRGGHLDDDPAHGKVITIRQLEQFVTDFVNLEMGMVLQNLGLMTQALGLGGFPHFANHEFAWFTALGFDCQSLPASHYLGTGPLVRWALRLTGKDQPVPLATRLVRDGQVLLQALCPPNLPTMSAAVDAMVERKFGRAGVFRGSPAATAWKEHAAVTTAVSPVSERAVAATKAYVEYVWKHYGRFPAQVPPFRCGLAHQVVHLDPEFYAQYYRPDALSDRQHADIATTAEGALRDSHRGATPPS